MGIYAILFNLVNKPALPQQRAALCYLYLIIKHEVFLPVQHFFRRVCPPTKYHIKYVSLYRFILNINRAQTGLPHPTTINLR